VRDDQVRRYARHLMLPDVGGLGQTALMVAAARIPLREREPAAELIAATYLAAGGVGTLIVPSSSEAQRAELAAHGPDSHVTDTGDGREVALAARPAWWPTAEGDDTAVAFWRGSIAAVAWMTDAFTR
jgi:hypothetical protein